MRLILIALLATVFGCASEPGAGEHPDTAPTASVVTGYPRKVEQPILPTNCDAPPHLFKTLSNIVVTSAVGVPSCPLAWSQTNDVTSWWIGYTDAAHAPVSPWGKCQWNSTTWPYGGNRCKLHQDFSCPNGVWYTADVRAAGSVWFPWGVTQASLMATYNDGTCSRLATATF